MKIKIVIYTVLVSLVLTSFLNVNASSLEEKSTDIDKDKVKEIEAQYKKFTIVIEDDEDNVGTEAVEVCQGHATHDMVASGIGFVYKGTFPDTNMLMISGGQAWQCSRCYLVLVTEWDPLETFYVGNYAFSQYSEPINHSGCVMWTNTVKFTSDSRVPYCSLRYYW